MRRFVVAGMLAVILASAVAPAHAVPDDYEDSQSHPIRVAAYLIHPVGFTIEWLVFRPFHYVVSRPLLNRVFGHRPHEDIGGYR